MPVLKRGVLTLVKAIAADHLPVCIRAFGYWTVLQAGVMAVEMLEARESTHAFRTKKFLTGFKK